MELALNRSFFYPSNEPYGGIAGFYDYGPVGILLKKKIEDLWRRRFIKELGFYEVESSIITPERVLLASGHVDNFTDPIVECERCHAKFRADHIAEEQLEHFKWNGSLEELQDVFNKHKDVLKCPNCQGNFGKVKVFNLMFKTGIGADKSVAYTRPETAQGIFTSFIRLWRNHGGKLPMAVGQVGKSFRNEISPRNVLVRMREFTQMELEYFFNPKNKFIEGFEDVKDVKMRFLSAENQKNGKGVEVLTAKDLVELGLVHEIFAYFLAKEWQFYEELGLNMEKCRFRQLLPSEVPHYSNGNVDMEIETSYGVIETISNADRSNYDLSQHQKFSGKKFEIYDAASGERLVPHVFEVSLGVDRLVFALMEHCLKENEFGEFFAFNPIIAPYDVAVLPLMKRDGIDKKAKELAKELSKVFDVLFMDTGSMGKRFWRCDGIGVPYSIITDYQTLIDGTVTLRTRDDGYQIRIKENEIKERITALKLENKTTQSKTTH